MKQFKYLETALTNQNSIHEELKIRLKSQNAYYYYYYYYYINILENCNFVRLV